MSKKKSGYMIFVMEWKEKNNAKLSVSQAVEKASRFWEELTPGQRNHYNQLAKRGNKSVKKVSVGPSFTPEDHVRNMKREIEQLVQQSVQNNNLTEQTYIFVMLNYFTKSIRDNMYVPAEIGACEYSIKDGISRKYHAFINPGVTTYGHQYETLEHSRSTHNLPVPPKAKGSTDLGRLYNELLDFAHIPGTNKYSPIFTIDTSIEVVKSSIDFLRTDCEARDVDLKIFSIHHLFYILKEATCIAGDIDKPQNHFITDAIFDKDKFEYYSDMGCEFHEEIDRSKYCALSCVTRWGYNFSDYMCNDVAITPIPGRHVPQQTNLAAFIHEPSSSSCRFSQYKFKKLY